jgi:V8-like Glu-specific endopeptidase
MIENLAHHVCEAAEAEDIEVLRTACSALIKGLSQQNGSIDPALALEVLKCLRKWRRFGDMRRLANAFLEDGCSEPRLFHFLAQSMIEAGESTAAIRLLEGALEIPDLSQATWGELKAALGRVWKDRAVRCRGFRDKLAIEAIRESVRHYREVWLTDKPTFTYQGVNFVAMAAWDGGFALSEQLRAEASEAAAEIVEIISAKPEKERDSWASATMGEAYLGLNDEANALTHYHRYVKEVSDPFDLASTARQLQQIWRAGRTETGIRLLAPLLGKLGVSEGGAFSVSPEALERLAEIPKVRHEAILGNIGAQTHRWIQSGLKAARSVAMIRRNDTPHGTGFVVRGSDLGLEPVDELLVVTNAHVVSDPPEKNAAHWEEASVTFELGEGKARDQSYRVKKVLWQSPSSAHDVVVLSVEPPLDSETPPLKFASRLPDKHKSPVYIIGHPGGREVSFSLQDNRLIDYERSIYDDPQSVAPCRIHYQSPTEDGSSGSPVFDESWRVIGVHHGGGILPMLNGERGVYASNEGLWIEAIRRAIRATRK